MTQLRGVTCHMGSHRATYHPTQVNTSTHLALTCYIHRWFTRLQTVTHPSTNRAQCRLTTVIEVNALTNTLRRHTTWMGDCL